MGGIAEGAGITRRLVAGRDLEPAGVDVGRQVLRPQVPGPGDLAKVTLPLGPTTAPSLICTSLSSACSSAAPMRAARRAISWQARATAPPPITMQREPQVPVE